MDSSSNPSIPQADRQQHERELNRQRCARYRQGLRQERQRHKSRESQMEYLLAMREQDIALKGTGIGLAVGANG